MKQVKLLVASMLCVAIFCVSHSVSADPGIDNAKPQNAQQKQMLKTIDHWRDSYNNEVEKMVLDSYAKDADVVFTGASVHGHKQFLALENLIKKNAPGRYMRIDRVRFIGDDTAVVQAVLLDKKQPDFFTPWCAILSFNDDGKIVEDNTYLDPSKWLGLEGTENVVTAGGLGAE